MADIEEHIRKAIEEGKFDDLPGKGKPLKLEDTTHEDPDWRLAYHVLREGGFSLPWIELQQEIETETAALRASLRSAWEWRLEASGRGDSSLLVEQEWERVVKKFGEQVEKLNKRIFDFNLQAPSISVQRMKLDVERELEMVKSGDS
jgi:DnaJ homolog subfamily C member 28